MRGRGRCEIRRRGADRIRLEACVRRWRGRGARIRQRGRARRGRGSVEQLVLRRDVALRVDGKRRQAARVRRWRIARGGHGSGRRADPWRRLRAEQDRSADRMVGDGQRGTRPPEAAAVGVGEEFVPSWHHAGQHAAHDTLGRIGAKRARDVPTVEEQRHLVKRHRFRHPHLDQRIAAADQVGAIRQRPDLEVERRQLGLGFAQPLGLRRFCRCRSAFTTACDGDDREHCGYDETGPDGQNATHVHVAPGWARGDRALSGVLYSVGGP